MADTITHTWQTVEQAAVTLNVSTRTIARRIAGETIESRVDENGRRLVLVQTFGDPALAADAADNRQTADVGQDYEENALSVTGTSAIARPMNDPDAGYGNSTTPLLAVLQSTIDIARHDAQRARAGARWAWAGVGLMAALIAAGGMWVTARLTIAETKVDMLTSNVQTARTDLERSRSDLLIVSSAKAVADQRREAVEQQLTTAQSQKAAAEAELVAARSRVAITAAVAKSDQSPATQLPATQPKAPFVYFGRFVNLPVEPEGH